MNNKIQELELQSLYDTANDGLGGPRYEVDMEKFAKLIIEECILAVIVYDAGDLIKERFGLK